MRGRTWLVGVTSPDYTQLIWSCSIKIHFVDSQLLKQLLLAEPTSVSIKPSVPHAEAILICFRASETQPFVSCAEAILIY